MRLLYYASVACKNAGLWIRVSYFSISNIICSAAKPIRIKIKKNGSGPIYIEKLEKSAPLTKKLLNRIIQIP
jgi:hypothetical protein